MSTVICFWINSFYGWFTVKNMPKPLKICKYKCDVFYHLTKAVNKHPCVHV